MSRIFLGRKGFGELARLHKLKFFDINPKVLLLATVRGVLAEKEVADEAADSDSKCRIVFDRLIEHSADGRLVTAFGLRDEVPSDEQDQIDYEECVV